MKYPIAIFVTDTHLSEHTVDINYSIFNQIKDIALSLDVKIILHGGDIFTSRKGQPEIVLTTFNNILNLYAEAGLRMIAISGNHDRTSYVSTDSFLIPFDSHSAFDLISPTGYLGLGDLNFFFLPFYDEKLAYLPFLAKITEDAQKTRNNILITHIGISGVKSNSGITVENEVSASAFDIFQTVLVGHYHDKQVLGSRNHIIYTGSAYQANFGESPDKGCTIIFSDGSMEFIQLDFPKFVTYDVNAEDLGNRIVSLVNQKDKFRFRIQGKISKEKEGIVSELSSVGAKIEVTKEQFSEVNVQSSSVKLSSSDILNAFEEWSKDKDFQDKDFGKDLLLQNVK